MRFGVEDTDIPSGVANENEVAEEVDATDDAVVLVVWLLEEFLLDLIEL